MRCKRGLSPVIATILLVSIGLVLAVIVFIWARNFVGAAIDKQGRAIELLCEEVTFKAEAYSSKLYVENIGVVPIYGFEIHKKSFFGEISLSESAGSAGIGTGQTDNFDLTDFNEGDELIVIPILLGEKNNEPMSYVCNKEFGVEVVLGA